MDTKPQGPVKFFNYKVSYQMQNGDFQDGIITSANEGKIYDALVTLQRALQPTGPVSQIVIDIGNKRNTA